MVSRTMRARLRHRSADLFRAFRGRTAPAGWTSARGRERTGSSAGDIASQRSWSLSRDLEARCPVPGEGSSSLALYEWDEAARDAGVSPEGSGFRECSFHFVTDSKDAVDEVMRNAVAAGAAVVKDAVAAEWGGYSGYFSDPDGHLWKITTAA